MADQEVEFADGLFVKPPHANAPAFVKAKLSMKREELIAWLQSREGDWVNFDIKVSNSGKWYAAVDNWKPDQAPEQSHQQAPPPQNAPVEDVDIESIDL